MANWTAYPYSRGYIHITGPNMVEFDVGYLKDALDLDVKKHIWAYKLQRRMWRRMPIFPANSAAAVVETAPGPISHGPSDRIQYTTEDDKAIDAKVLEIVTTTWHSLGTCKMAPREKMGVLDKELSVYGLSGLKIAELSVPLENVGANTENTAFLVGEKAAVIFIKELGLGEGRARL